MKDRNVQFPNRFEIVPVPGTTNIFDVIPAPGAVYEEGTFWNKQNVLKDATAALYGKTAAAVPDEIFAAIAPYLPQIRKIATGYYVGTGEARQNINCGFKPKAVLVINGGNMGFKGTGGRIADYYGGLVVEGKSITASYGYYSDYVLTIENNGFSVYYAIRHIPSGSYVDGYNVYTNIANETYHFIAVG